jgi:hypothetical protein
MVQSEGGLTTILFLASSKIPVPASAIPFDQEKVFVCDSENPWA